jgi:hypothetical protein
MHNLYYELNKVRMADLDREAAEHRRALIPREETSGRRGSLLPLLASFTARRREASRPAAPVSEPAPAAHPSST